MKYQDQVVATLERRGYRQTSTLSNDEIILEKRVGAGGHLFAAVDIDGMVNGKTVLEFLAQKQN